MPRKLSLGEKGTLAAYYARLGNRKVKLAAGRKPAKRKLKYRNIPIFEDGIMFDSRAELNRWKELCLLARAGEITELRHHVPIPIQCRRPYGEDQSVVDLCKYEADFVYREKGVLKVEDVKNHVTAYLPAYRLKKRMLKVIYGIDIIEIMVNRPHGSRKKRKQNEASGKNQDQAETGTGRREEGQGY